MGLVDVKNTWIEPPELIAERLRTVLTHVDAGRVSVTPDCGFSQTARHVAVAKAMAMVDGVRTGAGKSFGEIIRAGQPYCHQLCGDVTVSFPRSAWECSLRRSASTWGRPHRASQQIPLR